MVGERDTNSILFDVQINWSKIRKKICFLEIFQIVVSVDNTIINKKLHFLC